MGPAGREPEEQQYDYEHKSRTVGARTVSTSNRVMKTAMC